MGKIHAFIFDLDGVITDTAEYHYLAWKACAEKLGIPFSRKDNEKLKGISRMKSLEIILRLGNKEKDYSESEKLEIAERKNEIYKRMIKKLTPNDILPGISGLLNEVKNHGLKLGLASASKNAFGVMTSLELPHVFDHIVDAATVKNGKPDPDIFLAAARALNVEPRHCVGIEDAASGIQAIKSAGMFAVGVGDAQVLAAADLVYPNTALIDYEAIIRKAEKN